MTGTYRILAENQHGKDEAEVEITVLSSPSKPGGPLKVTDVTKNGCKLAWKKPEDDGGKYIIFQYSGPRIIVTDIARRIRNGVAMDWTYSVSNRQSLGNKDSPI